jgi:hypothetical protein
LDVAYSEIPQDFHNADYAILMFVLSAIAPEKHEDVIKKINSAMKPGGILYFRDYCLYDMAQLRFAQRKKNKVSQNLYMRHDKTLAFYFDKEQIESLFVKNGFEVSDSKCICRMIENRKDNKKMHRLWLQIKLKKIIIDSY